MALIRRTLEDTPSTSGQVPINSPGGQSALMQNTAATAFGFGQVGERPGFFLDAPTPNTWTSFLDAYTADTSRFGMLASLGGSASRFSATLSLNDIYGGSRGQTVGSGTVGGFVDFDLGFKQSQPDTALFYRKETQDARPTEFNSYITGLKSLAERNPQSASSITNFVNYATGSTGNVSYSKPVSQSVFAPKDPTQITFGLRPSGPSIGQTPSLSGVRENVSNYGIPALRTNERYGSGGVIYGPTIRIR